MSIVSRLDKWKDGTSVIFSFFGNPGEEWGDKCMKRIQKSIKQDIWIFLLDIISVNASYVLALLIRFYVNGQFRPTVTYYMTDWARFAPWYTLACLIIFALWKLYGSMWRYAGINDMNRIIFANACTTVVHVLGTLIFIRRMPITYYVIGAALQFLFMLITRFAYRILLVEKKKLSKTVTVPALIIGSGELGHKVIRHLKENTPYRPVAIIGDDSGRSMDGVPVLDMTELESTVQKVRGIFIADRELSQKDRDRIAALAGDREIKDFTAELTNLSGVVPVTSLLALTSGPVTLEINGNDREFKSGRDALKQLHDAYEVADIEGAKIHLKKASTAWMNDYKAQTGEDVSFF